MSKPKGKDSKKIIVSQRDDGKWQGKKPGNEKASVVEDTKAEAMKRTREIAINQGLELIPKNGKTGRITNPNSYGNDPNPPKDKKH